MTSHLDELLATNSRLRLACATARIALAASYGITEAADSGSLATVAPVEVPSAAWLSACAAEEARLGRRIWKFFAA